MRIINDNALEMLDLVDDRDNVIGMIPRKEASEKRIKNIRVINGFIKNSKGQLWIPQRTKEKKAFPLALDFAFGGYVQSGESYDEACLSELSEELNITNIVPTLICKLTPKDDLAAFMSVYEILTDEVPNFNKEDFITYFWLTPEELIKKIEEGFDSKSDLPKVVKLIYLK